MTRSTGPEKAGVFLCHSGIKYLLARHLKQDGHLNNIL